VKNPKAAMISVVLPGEAPAIAPPVEQPEQMSLMEPLEPAGVSLKPKQRVVEINPKEPEPDILVQPEVEVSPSLESGVDASDLDQLDADGVPITRRRRRRSSAAVSE
jgi:hypothetical protein